MIVKVQLPLEHFGPREPLALVTSEDGLIDTHQPITPELKKAMKGAPNRKRYFNAITQGTILCLGAKAPDQSW